MSDSESIEVASLENGDVEDYLESLESGEEISFDDFKKVSDKFNKEDYMNLFQIEFDFDWCCYEEAEGLVEEFYKIVIFIYDQLDINMFKEEFQRMLEDCLIIQLKRSCNEFSISLLEKMYCESRFNFDINKFFIPSLKGLVNSKSDVTCPESHKNFKFLGNKIISFLENYGTNDE